MIGSHTIKNHIYVKELFMSANQKYTVRLKVAFDDKLIKDKITYQVFYLRKKANCY